MSHKHKIQVRQIIQITMRCNLKLQKKNVLKTIKLTLKLYPD